MDTAFAAQLLALYDKGDYITLLTNASDAWETRNQSLARTSAMGECCRLAMLSSRAVREKSAEQLREFEPGAVWRARALASFVESGFSNGVAMLLLQDFFELLEDRASAESVLDEMDSLVTRHEQTFCTFLLVKRVVAEKRGFLLWRHRDFAGSVEAFDGAIDWAIKDGAVRGVLKTQAGRELSVYCAAPEGSTIRDRAVLQTEGTLHGMQEAGVGGYVLATAAHNLSAMREARNEDLRPYEMV